MQKRKSNDVRSNYKVQNVSQAKNVAKTLLEEYDLENILSFGLPEIDDRYNIWRVPLKVEENNVGEIVIDAFTSLIIESKSTKKETLESRILKRKQKRIKKKRTNDVPKLSQLRNTIGHGDSEQLLIETPNESVDLIFTSPPIIMLFLNTPIIYPMKSTC